MPDWDWRYVLRRICISGSDLRNSATVSSVFGVVIAAVSIWLALLPITTAPTTALLGILALSLLVAIATLAAARVLRRPPLRPPEKLIHVVSADQKMIPRMNEVALTAFPPGSPFYISTARYEDFFARSPTGFRAMLKGEHGPIVGVYTVLPLKKPFAERVRTGDLLDPEITSDMLTRPAYATCLHSVEG